MTQLKSVIKARDEIRDQERYEAVGVDCRAVPDMGTNAPLRRNASLPPPVSRHLRMASPLSISQQQLPQSGGPHRPAAHGPNLPPSPAQITLSRVGSVLLRPLHAPRIPLVRSSLRS